MFISTPRHQVRCHGVITSRGPVLPASRDWNSAYALVKTSTCAGEMKRCLKNGLWLLRDNRGPYAIVMSQHDDYGHGSFQNVEVAAPPRGFGAELASRVFDASNGTSRAGHALEEGSCRWKRVRTGPATRLSFVLTISKPRLRLAYRRERPAGQTRARSPLTTDGFADRGHEDSPWLRSSWNRCNPRLKAFRVRW